MILLFILAYLSGNSETLIKPEIFTPTYAHNVAMSADGRIYLLDSGESQVRIYSEEYRLLKTFGQRGQGPEDLMYPVSLKIIGSQLHVSQAFKKTIFDMDGNFINSFKIPEGRFTQETPNGWLILFLSKTAYVFKFFSHDLSTERIVFQLERPENSDMPSMENPFPSFTVNSSGTRAYITQPNAFKVFIVDLAEASVISSFEQQTPLIPISEEWKKKQQRSLKQAISRMSPNRKVEEKSYPKYFPPIKSIETGADGNIFIFTFDPQNEIYTVDDNGNSSTSYIKSLEALRTVFAIKGKWAFLCDMVDEEAVIVRVPKDKIETYFKEK